MSIGDATDVGWDANQVGWGILLDIRQNDRRALWRWDAVRWKMQERLLKDCHPSIAQKLVLEIAALGAFKVRLYPLTGIGV